jgi:Cu-processing system permease protein
MAAGVFVALYYVRHALQRSDVTILVAVYFIVLKLALVIALALLFSSFTTPLLAILYTAGLYVAGQFVQEMRTFESLTPGNHALTAFTKWLSYLLPNFENFNVMALAAHGRSVPGALILQNTVYAAVYCGIVLFATMMIFSRRNLK